VGKKTLFCAALVLAWQAHGAVTLTWVRPPCPPTGNTVPIVVTIGGNATQANVTIAIHP